MQKPNICFILLVSVSLNNTSAEFNFTFGYAARCKPFDTLDGYAYKTFFQLEDLQHSRSPLAPLNSSSKAYQPPDASNVYVHMHIGVLAKADAHILFTEHPNANAVNPVYEIVLGAGGNSYSEIRKALRKNSIKSVRTANLLSPIRYTVFWIRISSDGIIEVGKEGEILPLMATKDPNPLHIKYFSLSSWGSSKASWLYDCPDPYGLTKSDTDSVRVRSVREQLIISLIKNYDPNVIPVLPGEIKQINAHHTLSRVTLNAKEAILDVRGKIEMSWIDNNLVWKPNDFDNITSIKFGVQDVWQPTLYLLNAAKISGSDILGGPPVDVTYKGVVTWNVLAHYKSWCSLGEGITKWPNDKHACEIKLASWSTHREFNVDFDFSFEVPKEHTGSDWSVTSAYTTNAMYNITDKTIRATVIKLQLRRKTSALNTLFHAPFIASVILNMLSLWMKDSYRVAVACLGVLILTPPFAMLGQLIPAHQTHVPVLVHYYVLGFFISWIMLVMAVLGSWIRIAPPTQAPPPGIAAFLNFKLTRWSMCLPSIKGDSYKSLMSASNSEDSWVTLGNALDRLVFFIISIALAASMLTTF